MYKSQAAFPSERGCVKGPLESEHFRYHKRDQQENESIMVYTAEHRRLAEHGEFGAGLSDVLCDRLVCGLHNENTQKWLLTKTDLTLETAWVIAVTMGTLQKMQMSYKGKAQESAW